MKTIVEARTLWSTGFATCPRLDDIKRATLGNDRSKDPCEHGLRSVCWKAFLMNMGFDTEGACFVWRSRLTASREAYEALRRSYLRYIDHPDDLPSTADPLADDDTSPWQTLRNDEALREEISQDVERCMQDNHYFRDPRTKRRMLDILFVWAKVNPEIGYRQGMHELLAPVLWVVDADAVGVQTEPQPWGDDETLLTTLDSRFLEHDSFTLFAAVMQNVKVLYEHGDGQSSGGGISGSSSSGSDGTPYEASIVGRSRRIHEVLLFKADYELAEHLAATNILPQIFVTRWLRLLFGREFPFTEVLSMWDMLFAEGLRLELLDYVCVAMLLRIRWSLLEADYTAALALLLKYPSPQPRHPRSFVSDALFLEKDPTIQGGSSVILKYSDRIPSFAGRSPSAGPPLRSAVVGPAMGLAPLRHGGGPGGDGVGSARIHKRLDSLLHGVSGGVAKAVKGAVVEARKNFQAAGSQQQLQQMQHHRAHFGKPASRVRTSGSSSTSGSGLSPSNPSAAAMAELNKRVFRLESRSKALGVMLAEALSQFRAGQRAEETARDMTELGKAANTQAQGNLKSSGGGDAESDEALPIDVLLAKVQFVQVYLEDPTIPIEGVEGSNPDSPFTIAGSEWDKLSIRSPLGSLPTSSPVGPALTAGGDEIQPSPPLSASLGAPLSGLSQAGKQSPSPSASSGSGGPRVPTIPDIPSVDGAGAGGELISHVAQDDDEHSGSEHKPGAASGPDHGVKAAAGAGGVTGAGAGAGSGAPPQADQPSQSQPQPRAQTRPSPQSKPTRRLVAAARAPLAESPFSFMLGDASEAEGQPAVLASRTAAPNPARPDHLFQDGAGQGGGSARRDPLSELGL
ncbi:hypothetical protein KEM52_000518 [Ascosphaera acerosa]|nr:hypothetical protein KEM52_000518 [Ascosphaera acerosa]